MTNIYAVVGPTAEQYQNTIKAHKHPQVAIAELRSMEGETQLMSFDEMKAFYVANELFRPSGCVYAFFITEDGKPQCEIYPDASWLTIMQSPKMHPNAVGEADVEFQRMLANTEYDDEGKIISGYDNYAQIPVLWRGLETRAIAQVLTPRELGPEMDATQVIFRPLYLLIDPFLLAKLGAPKGFDKSSTAMAPPEPKGAGLILPPNVTPFKR